MQPHIKAAGGDALCLNTISAKPVGVGAAFQQLIPMGARSGLQTRIGTTESVSLCERMRS